MKIICSSGGIERDDIFDATQFHFVVNEYVIKCNLVFLVAEARLWDLGVNVKARWELMK